MFDDLKRLTIAIEQIADDLHAIRKSQDDAMELSRRAAELGQTQVAQIVGQFTNLLTGGKKDGQ